MIVINGYLCSWIYQAQLEEALSYVCDEDHFARQTMDAIVEMVEDLYDDDVARCFF